MGGSSTETEGTQAPRRVAGVRIADLPLSPEDAFVLSQLDGHTTALEVAELTGFSANAVLATIARLTDLGVLDGCAASRSGTRARATHDASSEPARRESRSEPSRRDPRRDPTMPPPEPSSARRRDPRRDETIPPEGPKPIVEEVVLRTPAPAWPEPEIRHRASSASRLEQPAPRSSAGSTSAPRSSAAARSSASPTPAPRSSAGLTPTAPEATPSPALDLSSEQCERIDEAFEKLEYGSHYELLGVSRSADKKEIKAAYFQLITFFHPDKYFRKEIGEYKKKLEQIFQRYTEANETLTRKKSREEYDAYLGARRATRALDAVMTSIPPPPKSEHPPRATATDDGASTDGISISAASTGADSADAEPRAPLSQQERSQAFARRLAGGSSRETPKQRSDPAAASAAGAADRNGVADTLRRLVDSRKNPQVDKFVQAGKDALEKNEYVSAVNALRIALTLSPNDQSVRTLYEQAEEQASQKLAESYESRARYEEKNANWEAAASSWERVAAARKEDAEPLRRAAECYASTGDPKRGIGPGRQAALLAPDVASNHITLAKLYEVCGMIASALAEAKRALATRPKDEEMLALIARLDASN